MNLAFAYFTGIQVWNRRENGGEKGVEEKVGKSWCRDTDMECQREKKKDRQRQLSTQQPTTPSLSPAWIVLLWAWVWGVVRPHMERTEEMEMSRASTVPLFRALVGHPEWDSRVQRKGVCFSLLIFYSQRQAIRLLELSRNSACTALPATCVDFRFELLQAWVILISVGGWVSWAWFYISNLILEIETPRAGKVKWPAQDHTESCGREATSITLSP